MRQIAHILRIIIHYSLLIIYHLQLILGGNMILEYTVNEKDKNKTIKEYLLKQAISHRLILTLKNNNCILCNDMSVYTNHVLRTGDKISLNLNYPEESDNIVSTNIPLNIIHEDESMLILNKPAGIPVHPSIHYYSNTLSNGVKYYYDSIRVKKEN